MGGRWLVPVKSNANSHNDIVPFRIGLYHRFGAYCTIPPSHKLWFDCHRQSWNFDSLHGAPPFTQGGACAQKPEPGSILPTDDYNFSFPISISAKICYTNEHLILSNYRLGTFPTTKNLLFLPFSPMLFLFTGHII